MAIRVQIPVPLRTLTGGAAEVGVDASGELRSYVRVFVNEEDVRFLGGKATPLKAGDVVAIVPAIAGGR